MEQRRLKMVLSVGLLAAASACASGDGVPTAGIANGLDTCIVEASYLNYAFVNPIGPNGRMASREVVLGEDVAYAVTMDPTGGRSCADMASERGGTLWITNGTYATEVGKLTTIDFDENSARVVPVECGGGTPYIEGLKRFTRLSKNCEEDVGTPPGDAGSN